MKLKKLLLAGVLTSTMGLGFINPISIQATESSDEVNRVVDFNKDYPMAFLNNLSLVLTNATQNENLGKVVDFNKVEEGLSYYLSYEDLVEHKFIASDKENYYHTTFENLTPDIIEFFSEEGPTTIFESKDTGMMQHNNLFFQANKTGTAKIRCTIYERTYTDNTETEIITLTVNKATPLPDKNQNEITFNGSSDMLLDDAVKADTITMINQADTTATITLGMKEKLSAISLPKEILQAAKDKNIPLTVNVTLPDSSKTTWTFPNSIDNLVDVNLAMSVVKASDIETLKDKDGLVLAFNHNGVLPTGTTVKTYVGDTYKAGDKVQLSYFNDKTNTLEETKEYIVDVDGYVTVVINHCSNYLLEAVKENVVPTPEPNPTPAPNPTPTPAPTPVPGTVTPSDTEKKTTDTADTKKETPAANEKGKGSVATGDTTNTMVLLGMMVLSTMGLLVFKKKAKNI